jgi:hypothetical protein
VRERRKHNVTKDAKTIQIEKDSEDEDNFDFIYPEECKVLDIMQ